MEIPALAIDKESQNLYYIYLFYVDDRWCAFGYSAYYLSLMYPELDAFSESFFLDDGDCLPFLPVPETLLSNISDYYTTLASDAYIQVSAPPKAYSRRRTYDEWCDRLIVNKNQLHILKHL